MAIGGGRQDKAVQQVRVTQGLSTPARPAASSRAGLEFGWLWRACIGIL